MKIEVFRVSIDPHPDGQLRLMHEGKPSEIWDYETTSGIITIRKIIEIIDYYCFVRELRAKIYFEQNALDFIKARIAAMQEELDEYKYIVSNIVYPFEEKTAAMRQHNNRSAKKGTSH